MKKPTRIYCVSGVEDTPNGYLYLTTKKAAHQLARSIAKEGGYANVSIDYVSNDLRKPELYCALLNGTGWSTGEGDEELRTVYEGHIIDMETVEPRYSVSVTVEGPT